MTIFYIVQAKLSAAVDGAALGAGRLIGTSANIEQVADLFLQANFRPVNYMGARELKAEITYTRPNFVQHIVTVAATVSVDRVFGHLYSGEGFQAVAANAVATRKDSRIVVVLDRSGSMSGQMTSLRGAAKDFTKSFVPNTDQLGLVVYDSSALVAYPRYPGAYSFDPTISGGPDEQFWDGEEEGATNCTSTDMVCSIGKMVSGGHTAMAEGMQLAFIELQKAHTRDAAKPGEEDRLNVVVLFTDGVPNVFPAYLNDPRHVTAGLDSSNSLKPYGAGLGQSPCTWNPDKWSPPTNMPAADPVGSTDPTKSTAMIGVIGAFINTFPNWVGAGISSRQSVDTNPAHTVDWLLKNPYGNPYPVIPNKGKALSGCLGATTGRGLNGPQPADNNSQYNLTDLKQIPATDAYGNSTDSTAYVYSKSYIRRGIAYNRNIVPTGSTGGYQLALTSWILVDNIANTIRSNPNMKTVVYTIGYEGSQSGGDSRVVDDLLLQRVANDPDAPGYNAAQQQGKFYRAKDEEAIGKAFTQIAAEVLRLAK
jgi:hypothetical protein